MKKEFTNIFWKLYSINKDAQKLQEVFMPSNDREILKDLIYATSDRNFKIVFWPDSYRDELNKTNFSELSSFLGYPSTVIYSSNEINWSDTEYNNLRIEFHVKVLVRVMKIIDNLRYKKAENIEDKTTQLKSLLLDFCDLWDEYIKLFWDYLGFEISIGRLSIFIREYEDLSKSYNSFKITKERKEFLLEYQKKYFEARYRIKDFFVLYEELSSERFDKEQEEEEIKLLMEDNDENFEEVEADNSEEIDEADIGFVYFVRNKDIYKIGKTNNMLRRMKQLEPDELLDSVRCSNYHQLEREVQAQFKAVRIPQTEYYRLNKEQIKKVYELLRKGAK